MSALSELQDRLRRNLAQVPGYAGGNLQDQLVRDAQLPGPEQAAKRPIVLDEDARGRTVPVTDGPPPPDAMAHRIRNAPLPPEMKADIDQQRKRVVSYDIKTGRPNRDFYHDKPDALEGSMGYYDALHKWEPRGGKRGFKNSLKSGAMAAAEAVRANPDDPVTAALAGFGIGAAGSAASPNMTGRLRRNMDLQRAGGELGQQLKFAGDEAKIAQSGMVPVQLNDGRVVMAPAKQAGTLTSQQQGIAQRDQALKRADDTLAARTKRWDALNSKDRRASIVAEYKAGMLNDPDSLEKAARELNIPGKLLPAFISGQMRDAIDDEGNLIQVNRQTGVATPVTQEGQPVQGIQKTLEAGRNRRAAAAQTGMSQRQAARASTSTVDRPTQRKVAELVGNIERARKAMESADAALGKNPNDKGAQQRRSEAEATGNGWATQLNALGAGYEAGPGEKGYPYYKKKEGAAQSASTARYAGRTISQANLERYANDNKMTPAQAKAALGLDGVTVR